MKRMMEQMTGQFSSSASIVDGTLVLSLPDAISPVVWRLELTQTKASALEVREQEDETFLLVLKTPRGDVNTIATYATRGRAVSALMAVTRAMENAHGQIYGAANDSPPFNPTHLPVPTRARKLTRNGKNWIGMATALSVIVVLGFVLINLTPKPLGGLPDTSPAAGSSAKATIDNGVAVSADEFLKSK